MSKFFSYIFIFFITASLHGQEVAVLEKRNNDIINSNCHDTLKARAYIDLCNTKTNSSPLLAMYYADKARKIAIKYAMPLMECQALVCLSTTNRIIGDVKKSIDHIDRALKISEKIDNSQLMADCYHELALVSMSQNDFNKALEYQMKTVSIYKLNKSYVGLSGEYNNMGITYANMGKWNDAIKYFREALNIELKRGNDYSLGNDYNNIGVVYLVKKDLDSCSIFLNKGLDYRIKANDKLGMSGSYNNFALLELERNNVAKALEFADKSYQLCHELQSINQEIEVLDTYVKIFTQNKNFEKALDYFVKKTELTKKKENEAYTKRIVEMRSNIELEKKEKEIVEKDLQIEKAAEVEKKKNYIILISIFGLLSLIVVVVSVLRSIRKVKSANEIISSQKHQVEMQKKIIEEKHKDITDSINYAQKIQNALILSERSLNEKLNQNVFVYFKPRDIVSGDFYWFSEKNGLKLLAVADCTGHGVPGAFMSMIGITLLNQIVNEKGIVDPAGILNDLRDGIISSLNQTNDESGKRDGMDVALIAWNEKQLTYAGANNPCFVSRGNEVIELKADKQPVGLYEKQSPFTTQILDLSEGDAIYLFTDGIVDQFGGSEGKKVKTRTFKTWITEMGPRSAEQQKMLLNDYFSNWKKGHHQVDDILVIGIKNA